MEKANIYANIPMVIPQEIFQELFQSASFKIERIISKGQVTPPNHWYDQPKNEWIILLQGKAGLLFAENQRMIELKPGDYLNIPAHCRHRVEYTDMSGETIWLAIHY